MPEEKAGSGIERVGRGSCPGSFGELLQGVLPERGKFLVNLKIKNTSRVTLTLSAPRYSEKKEARFAESYRRYPKSYKVIRNICTDLGNHSDCYLEIESDIPVGKGLSSSTADMVAGIQALASALSVVMKPDYIGRMLTEIEPNDGLQHEGTGIYHHTAGALIAQFPYIPPLKILGIDLGGTIDTVQFNQQAVEWSEPETRCYQDLLQEMQDALGRQDLPALCRIATESARLWQKVNPKRELDDVLALMGETGALGVVNAHSGTYLGLLYGEGRTDLDAVTGAVARRLPGKAVRWFETVSCGSPNGQEPAHG
ncbi:MAG: hypothetical protein AAB333_02090 [Pseudomonadota bacterium]